MDSNTEGNYLFGAAKSYDTTSSASYKKRATTDALQLQSSDMHTMLLNQPEKRQMQLKIETMTKKLSELELKNTVL